MPMHSDRRQARGGRSRSELDRFLEDPWDEQTGEAFAADDDDWYPELFEGDGDEDRLVDLDAEDEDFDEDDQDDAWGPIRKRRRSHDDD